MACYIFDVKVDVILSIGWRLLPVTGCFVLTCQLTEWVHFSGSCTSSSCICLCLYSVWSKFNGVAVFYLFKILDNYVHIHISSALNT